MKRVASNALKRLSLGCAEKDDLKTMQQRLINAKSSYDTEVVRKQAEVSELEASMQQLRNYVILNYSGLLKLCKKYDKSEIATSDSTFETSNCMHQ